MIPQVIGNYFQAQSIPILRGRDFTPADRDGAPMVVIVNRTLAEHYWPGQDPIGKRLHRGPAERRSTLADRCGRDWRGQTARSRCPHRRAVLHSLQPIEGRRRIICISWNAQRQCWFDRAPRSAAAPSRWLSPCSPLSTPSTPIASPDPRSNQWIGSLQKGSERRADSIHSAYSSPHFAGAAVLLALPPVSTASSPFPPRCAPTEMAIRLALWVRSAPGLMRFDSLFPVAKLGLCHGCWDQGHRCRLCHSSAALAPLPGVDSGWTRSVLGLAARLRHSPACTRGLRHSRPSLPPQ